MDDAILTALQQKPADEELFSRMREACLLKYARYFTMDIADTLRKETRVQSAAQYRS